MAISNTEILIVSPEGSILWRGVLDPEKEHTGSLSAASLGASLSNAIGAVRAHGVARARVADTQGLRIALLAPLVDVRMVALPPVSDDDARRLLVQSAPRYFLGVAAPLIVGVGPADTPFEPGAMPTRVASAVAAEVIEALQSAARDASCHLELVVPALAAWCRSVTSDGVLIVNHPDSREVVEVAMGAPRTVRRFSAQEETTASAEAQMCAAQREGAGLRRIDDPLAAAAKALVANDGSAFAMQFAIGPVLGSRRTRRGAANVGRQRVLIGLGIMALAAAPLAFEWSAKRQLAAVQAERAALGPALAKSAPLRLMQEQLQTMSASDSTAQPVSQTLAALSDALPDDAWVARLRLRGDSIVVDARAQSAVRALEAIAGTPMLGASTMSTSVRRDTSRDGEPFDRFEFAFSRQPVGKTGRVPQP
ncbi:PilN domain-containing protein [Gemmatimonas sp.]